MKHDEHRQHVNSIREFRKLDELNRIGQVLWVLEKATEPITDSEVGHELEVIGLIENAIDGNSYRPTISKLIHEKNPRLVEVKMQRDCKIRGKLCRGVWRADRLDDLPFWWLERIVDVGTKPTAGERLAHAMRALRKIIDDPTDLKATTARQAILDIEAMEE